MDLFVGDLHCKSDNLEDTATIFDLIISTIRENTINNVIFLGDVFHNHNAVNLTVAHFVQQQFSRLQKEHRNIVVLAGNHDGHSPKSVEINAVDVVLGQYAKVVCSKYFQKDGYVFMPFYGDGQEFLNVANSAFKKYGDQVLVCHQSFIGGVYENGHPISDGVYPSDVPFSRVINGHIHKFQNIASKIICLGTPRAISTNESNDQKSIFLFNMTEFKAIPTTGLVKAYHSIQLHEPELFDLDIRLFGPKDDVRVHVHGSKEYYNNITKIPHKGFKFVPHLTKNTKKDTISIEKEGSLLLALNKYIQELPDLSLNIKEKVCQKIHQHFQT